MWHFTSRSSKWKQELSHVLVFSVPQLPSSLFCSSTWEDGEVLCGSPYQGGWRSPLWTALPGRMEESSVDCLAWAPLPFGSQMVWPMGGPGRRRRGGGGISTPFPSLQFCQRQWFCWVAPLSWLWPSLGSSYLIPLLPSAPMGGNGFLQFLVHGCFTSPL